MLSYSDITPGQVTKVLDYIQSKWDESVHDDRKCPPPDNVVPLPVPHTVPCLHGHFPVFFYWDTYFTNAGLLAQGRDDIARSNCEAMAWLIERYGFIPNNTFKCDINRSQPPYFSLMVREVYEHTGDPTWLRKMIPYVKREYQFWMTARHTPLGLNHHGEHADRAFLLRFYDGLLHKRLGLKLEVSEQEKLTQASRYLSEAETGWDFNPRFRQHCPDFCPVDLNSNLWRYEKDLAFYAAETGSGEAGFYNEKADRRQALITQYLWQPEKGLFYDFNHLQMIPGTTASLAAYHPLWLGLCTAEQAEATIAQLARFELPYGLTVCENTGETTTYQWGYPNGWPPLTYTVVQALQRYGRGEDAKRIAAKYVAWSIYHFERTGQLWEKFDAATGEIAGGEYEAQPMMGWSAGIFVKMAEILQSSNL